jgi:uncharacterized protein (TIGR02231 family)
LFGRNAAVIQPKRECLMTLGWRQGTIGENHMHKYRLVLVLLATTAATPVLVTQVMAATIPAASKIDAVTVFPSGAEITRVAEAKIAAGEHALVFENLPGDLMAETIRVEGSALGQVEIGSVDARLAYVPQAAADARRKTFESQIQALEDERRVLDQTIADAEYQKNLMQQLASSAFTLPAKEEQARSFDAADLGQLLDLVGGKLQSLSKLILESQLRQRQIDLAITDLSHQMASLAPQQQARMTVTVHLVAPAALSGTFRLRYRIAGAQWQPVYDARLTSPEAGKPSRIEIVRRAAVTQSTSEDWNNVALTLSTARPVGATSAPDINPQLIGGHQRRRAENDQQPAMSNLDAPEVPASEEVPELRVAQQSYKKENIPAKARQLEAKVEVAGFQALYAIPGRVSIDNTGTAKNVRIDTSAVDAKLTARAVPKLDPSAYLTAAFTLNGETPLLPGTAMLYRDGVFMGQGYLPMLSPGEETRLGFGADDLIKVKRVEVTRLRGEEGIISTSNVDTRAYDITVKNLHGFTIPVTVLDQTPYSTQEDIVVETLSGMTIPSLKDFERKRGVLAWNFDLEPKAEKVLKHGFKLTWPETMEVGMNLN